MHLHYKRKFFFLYCLRSCFISDDWWLGSDTSTHSQLQVPDILDNAYVVVDYENGVRGMLDLCMFAEGSRNEQEICVVGTRGKVCISTSIATFSKDSEQVSETNLNFLILQNCPVQLLMLGMQKSNLSFYSSFEEQSISSLGRGRLLYQRALFDLGHGIVAEKEF